MLENIFFFIFVVCDLCEVSCGLIGVLMVINDFSENVIFISLDDLYNWVCLSSFWFLFYGMVCCFIEFVVFLGFCFDFDCFGLVLCSFLCQVDLLIVVGMVIMKMVFVLVWFYEQMLEFKYVIVMGVCIIIGGMFSVDFIIVVCGVDKLILVDFYLLGCLFCFEVIFDVVIKLCKKVGDELLVEWCKYQQIYWYMMVFYQMKCVEFVVIGFYFWVEFQKVVLVVVLVGQILVIDVVVFIFVVEFVEL